MENDYEDQGRINEVHDVLEVSDATVQSMEADLRAAGRINSAIDWSVSGEERVRLRLQIMGHFWRELGRPVWVRSRK